MSYSQVTPCFNCDKKEKCTDHIKLNNVVQEIHKDGYSTESGHMGSGSIILQCFNFNKK